ncbi:hypothetical protein FC89_GL000680 [Liquorilactobacillus ghanensis DSM 18630]|uniref:Uncharacterized protein n=1 Tax=Liquorilactobacillus ghanensis DSM 18630 TaxID=1423750 RepID=A0A0R1VT29_9LACO|nr:hypothetical protein FC89_GL000680 [Liquorilactobacillus ghanensis DSM 18630]
MAHQGASTVTDKNSQAVYLVVGKWGRHNDVLSVYAISGELLAEIKQTGFGIFPSFNLYLHNQHVGRLKRYHFGKKDLLLVRKLNWMIIGDIYSFNYRIYHRKDLIMQLAEVSLLTGNYLELKITAEKDEPLCLCIVAILDYFAQKPIGKQQKNYNLNIKFD